MTTALRKIAFVPIEYLAVCDLKHCHLEAAWEECGKVSSPFGGHLNHCQDDGVDEEEAINLASTPQNQFDSHDEEGARASKNHQLLLSSKNLKNLKNLKVTTCCSPGSVGKRSTRGYFITWIRNVFPPTTSTYTAATTKISCCWMQRMMIPMPIFRILGSILFKTIRSPLRGRIRGAWGAWKEEFIAFHTKVLHMIVLFTAFNGT